jgi:phosphatidylglycerol---prolipoprotein diacylglyceryl transferase
MHEAYLIYPNIDPVLVHLGPLAIRWYALAYIAGLLLGWWLILRMLAQKSLWAGPPFDGRPPATADEIGDLVVWATLGVILGGRFGWVIFYGTILCSVSPHSGYCQGLPMAFITDPVRIVAAWKGGMSFHGGLVGVGVALYFFCRARKLDLLKVGDLASAVAPIGLFFGRIANFVNGELWGKPAHAPWAMIFCNDTIRRAYGSDCPAGIVPRHPSQLYEAALEGLVLFAILQLGIRVFGWQRRPGLTTAAFLLGYGIFRAFVELFREPDAPFLGPVSMGQMLSFVMWFAGAYLFWRAYRKPA